MRPRRRGADAGAGGTLCSPAAAPGPVRLEAGPPAAPTRYACRAAVDGGGVTGVSSVDTRWATGPSTS